MRRSSAPASSLPAFLTGLVIGAAAVLAAAVHVLRTVLRRTGAPATAPDVTPRTAAAEQQDAVVLPFERPAAVPVPAPVVDEPAAPARCGDNGGVTKAGAPCGARAAAGGRCRHHQLAA